MFRPSVFSQSLFLEIQDAVTELSINLPKPNFEKLYNEFEKIRTKGCLKIPEDKEKRDKLNKQVALE
jgi:hypothetical protein